MVPVMVPEMETVPLLVMVPSTEVTVPETVTAPLLTMEPVLVIEPETVTVRC